MKMRPASAELFNTEGRTDGRADITKLIIAFRNFSRKRLNMKKIKERRERERASGKIILKEKRSKK